MMTLLRILCAAVLLLSLRVEATMIRFHGDLKLSVPERETLQSATRDLKESGKDLSAVEIMIAFFPPEFLDGIGYNVSDSFEDPALQAAWKELLDWYSIDFLEAAMVRGSDDAAYWAMRKLDHQSINGPSRQQPEDPNAERLVERGGVVNADVLRRLGPALEKLQTRTTARTQREASRLIARWGLLTKREDFREVLRERDEAKLNDALMRMLDTVRVDPKLTPEMWEVIARARGDALMTSCMRYPWLFELPTWDAEKTRLLAGALRWPGGGPRTNVNTALSVLAMSANPLTQQILTELAATDDPRVKGRVAKYQELYEKHHPAAKP